MRVLIIYAHPNPNSFNAAIRENVERGLRDGNQTYTVIDLYAEHFDPVLVFNDTVKRRDLHRDPEMARYRELVLQADHLIFIYPVWWYGVPAILKGFFDRVFASHFAYKYEGLLPVGLLKGKSASVVYTIDSPGWFVRLVRRNSEWTVIRRAILQFCGIRRVKRLIFAGVKTSSEKRREKWLHHVYIYARDRLR